MPFLSQSEIPVKYSGDVLVYVILSLTAFLGIIIGLIVYVSKNELNRIRDAIHELRNAIQVANANTILELVRMIKEREKEEK